MTIIPMKCIRKKYRCLKQGLMPFQMPLDVLSSLWLPGHEGRDFCALSAKSIQVSSISNDTQVALDACVSAAEYQPQMSRFLQGCLLIGLRPDCKKALKVLNSEQKYQWTQSFRYYLVPGTKCACCRCRWVAVILPFSICPCIQLLVVSS